MTEYIERESAIEAIMSEPPDAHYPQWYAEKIKSIPAADVAPVVRCRDCKHWKKDVEGCTEFVGRCAYANYMIGANGYCLYGEREENG